MTLGERIKKVRIKSGKTQQAFAESIGLKRNTIANFERDAVNPSARTLNDICRIYEINFDWLNLELGDMKRQKSRDEKIAAFVGAVLSNESDSDFKKRLIFLLSQMTPAEWAAVETIAKKLADDLGKGNDENHV